MSKQRWSPEPWSYLAGPGSGYRPHVIVDALGRVIDRESGDVPADEARANLMRRYECVKACEGISDPAAALAAAREALETACYGIYSEPENVKELASKALALLTPEEIK